MLRGGGGGLDLFVKLVSYESKTVCPYLGIPINWSNIKILNKTNFISLYER